MKICLIVEGAYPYVQGGVSSWIDAMVTKMPQYEFVVQSIAATRKDSGQFKYAFPQNLTAIKESFLQDDDIVLKKKKRIKLNEKDKAAIRSLVFRENEQWEYIFDMFCGKYISVNDILMSKGFYDVVHELYQAQYARVVFTDFLWTMRSVFLPIFLVMKTKPIEAGLYHTVSTGYAGVLACSAGHLYNKPVILTEHGIYTREREEEIIRSSWTKGIYKDLWINHFYMLSHCVYERATRVFSLFENARQLQIEIGCPPHKTETIHNGVDISKFGNVTPRIPDSYINIGAIVRVTPIKDIKTLINSFHIAKTNTPNLKLYIIGSTEEDKDYYKECAGLADMLGTKDIVFTGYVDVREYLQKMDIIILTSISEGQPLSILEAMAAGKPCITTRVGDCYDMLNAGDEEGRAGIVEPVMNVGKIAKAMQTLANDAQLRSKMGENGREIVRKHYDGRWFISRYDEVYTELYGKNYKIESGN